MHLTGRQQAQILRLYRAEAERLIARVVRAAATTEADLCGDDWLWVGVPPPVRGALCGQPVRPTRADW